MKNSLYQKRNKITVKRFFVLFLAVTLLFSLCACASHGTAPTEAATDEAEELQPIIVEREAGPEVLQTANEATALALRYYIYARLKTEELIGADFESMPEGAFENMMDGLVSIWETVDTLTSEAENITDQAVQLLESESSDKTAAYVQPQVQFAMLAANGQNFPGPSLADKGWGVIDRHTWAENLSKQYDALRGAQRYKQLAQQLGTDTKTAVEQMALAQKIIRNAADLEEAQAVSDEYNRCVNTLQVYKTGSKVGLYLGVTVATGGGSLAALAGSSMSVPVAGTVIVGGVDCIVDVGATASTIVLGENHQVTVDFQKASDVLQPASMVMGLITMNPNDPIEQIALIGESVMEWFVPGKYTGMAIDKMKAGGSRMVAQIVDAAEKNVPGARETLEKALEAIGLSLPTGTNVTLENLLKVYTVNSETAAAKMQGLKAQIVELVEEGAIQSQQPQEASPSGQEEGGLTGEQQNPAMGPITTQEIAGTYSGSATLQYVAEGMEADDSIDVTLVLNTSGIGTANVFGFGGEAQCAGGNVSFSVTMEEYGAKVLCMFEGTASRSGGQTVISGVINCSMMGVTFASYAWTAHK